MQETQSTPGGPSGGKTDPQSPDSRRLDDTGSDLGLIVEIAKRAADQGSLDDLYFLLVNEFRSVLEFDRCFLITHVGGHSSFVAASHQPAVERKSAVYGNLSELAPVLKGLDKGILLKGHAQDTHFPADIVQEELKSGLIAYLHDSQCTYLLCVPLVHRGSTEGHLLFEFFGEKKPDQQQIMVFLSAAPLLAAALVQQWLLKKRPRLARLLEKDAREATGIRGLIVKHRWPIALIATLLLLICLFLPLDHMVSGESVVVTREKHVAFCRIDGLIDKVFVAEGVKVKQDQELAVLDPTELNYRLETARRRADIFTRRIGLLRREADTNPSKLGDLKILELERQKVLREIEHIKWESGFLLIKAPTDGFVLTRDVQTLAGKKLRGGDPLCEIVRPDSLIVEILVPEDKVGLVKPGQRAYILLNNDPMTGYGLRVEEISPSAEPVPRLGNCCRVQAHFVDLPPDLKIGMKGVGKIYTEKTTIARMIVHGFMSFWVRLSLYF